MQPGEQGAQAVLCFVVLPCAVLLRCNQKQMLTAPACEILGGWKQSCFCAPPSRLRPCAGQMLRLINGPSLVGLAWYVCACARVRLRLQGRGEKRELMETGRERRASPGRSVRL